VYGKMSENRRPLGWIFFTHIVVVIVLSYISKTSVTNLGKLFVVCI